MTEITDAGVPLALEVAAGISGPALVPSWGVALAVVAVFIVLVAVIIFVKKAVDAVGELNGSLALRMTGLENESKHELVKVYGLFSEERAARKELEERVAKAEQATVAAVAAAAPKRRGRKPKVKAAV